MLRVLCEAQKYHHVDEQIMCSGVRYILSKQRPDGAFDDESPIYHKEMLVRSRPIVCFTISNTKVCGSIGIYTLNNNFFLLKLLIFDALFSSPHSGINQKKNKMEIFDRIT